MNKDKSIKDLKLYNDKIKTQLEYSKVRVWSLERENDRLKEYSNQLESNYDLMLKNNDNKLLMDYKSRIEKAVEYINHLSKEPNAFGHYGIHNDCAKWLLKILNGRSDE